MSSSIEPSSPPSLTPEEVRSITARTTAAEARTGTQIVTAIVRRSDAYPDLMWKGFALGASIAGLAVVIEDVIHPSWLLAHAALWCVLSMLGAGAGFALAVQLAPPLGRLLLDRRRRDEEVRQHAEALFLEHELWRTKDRTAVLLLVSLFERKIHVVPDVGLRTSITEAQWGPVLAAMATPLRAGRGAAALEAGILTTEALLVEHGVKGEGGDAFSDQPIEGTER